MLPICSCSATALYGSSALRNFLFGRNGTGENQRHKRSMTSMHHNKLNEAKENSKKKRNGTVDRRRMMMQIVAADGIKVQ